MSIWMIIDGEMVDLSTFNNIYKRDTIQPTDTLEPEVMYYYIVFVDTFNEQEDEYQAYWMSQTERDEWFQAIFSHLSASFINNNMSGVCLP